MKIALLIIIIALSACKRQPLRPFFGGGGTKGGDDGSSCEEDCPDEDKTGTDDGKGKRLWRLSIAQQGQTLNRMLETDVTFERRFEAEIRPDNGFANDPTSLAMNGAYLTKLEGALEFVLSRHMAALEKKLPCGTWDQVDEACAQTLIKDLGALAFRRPMSSKESKRYTALFTKLKTAGLSPKDSVQATVEAILRSPFAQFRSEAGVGGSVDSSTVRLGPYELASALSYGLTNQAPDESLLKAASDGKLETSEGLKAEVNKLLASDAFVYGFSDFLARWSGAQWLNQSEKDKGLFPEYSPDVRTLMDAEFKSYVQSNIKDHGASFKHLLTGAPSTVAAGLASIYGIADAKDTVTLNDQQKAQRAGIFALPATLVANSKLKDSSPVHRGNILSKHLMCRVAPPTPPNLIIPDVHIDPNAALTTRQTYEKLTSPEACTNCHAIMEPFGFALENYDAIGRYRAEEFKQPINAAGELAIKGKGKVKFANALEMMTLIADSTEGQNCFIRHVFRYSFGRTETEADTPLLAAAAKSFRTSDFDMRSILRTFYTSDAFLERSRETE